MAHKMWGGRFAKRTDPLVEKFTRSVHYDYKIAGYDVIGSLLHVSILAKVGYLTTPEAKRLLNGLRAIYASIRDGKFKPDLKCEDVHTQIQNMLQQKTGDVALKLHTARSRNDQVVFATKLYCKDNIIKTRKSIWKLVNAIAALADRNKDIIIPGFTHLQHAQPVYLKDYLWTYIEMLRRDDSRLAHINDTMKITIGAGALAGTPISAQDYAFNPWKLLKDLGLGELKDVLNLEMLTSSMDAVSDRDFIIETVSALSIVAMHLSRLSEDLIIWATKEFDFVDIDESFCTGSSLMPNKKNPDTLELVRGYTGRVYGNCVNIFTTMKGLPLTYNRDMQHDKWPLFDSFEIVSSELEILAGLMKTLRFNEGKIREHLEDESLYATDLAYYLVDKGVPFKNAHTIVGRIVKYSSDAGVLIKEMPEAMLKNFCSKIEKNQIIKLFDPETSVRSKRSVKRTASIRSVKR